MKIIVDPDFPNSQLFVDIIHQVADRYMDRMIHNSIIAGKLATAEIHLHHRVPTEEECVSFEQRKARMLAMKDSLPRIIYESELTRTVYDSLHAEGLYQLCFENNSVFSRIDLHVNSCGCLREFAEIVAHEMTHMLVSNSHNFGCVYTSLEYGSAPYASSVHRWDPERDITYGNKMEELPVLAVSHWIVKDMPLPADPEDEERYMQTDSSLAALCNLMADSFGTSLNELHFLDEFTTEENHLTIPNLFWYAFSVNQFGCIIQQFDELMGDSAYETLCGYIEKYYDEEDNQYYEQAREMLQTFTQKMKEQQ